MLFFFRSASRVLPFLWLRNNRVTWFTTRHFLFHLFTRSPSSPKSEKEHHHGGRSSPKTAKDLWNIVDPTLSGTTNDTLPTNKHDMAILIRPVTYFVLHHHFYFDLSLHIGRGYHSVCSPSLLSNRVLFLYKPKIYWDDWSCSQQDVNPNIMRLPTIKQSNCFSPSPPANNTAQRAHRHPFLPSCLSFNMLTHQSSATNNCCDGMSSYDFTS